MKLNLIAVTLTLAALLPATLHAASHTWSGAVNGYFSNPGNWSSGGVPTLAETNSLVFPVGATRSTITNDIGALKLTSINLSGSGYVLRGSSTLTFMGNLIDIQAGGATNTIESPIHFNSVGAVSVGPDDALALAGAVSGTNGFVKYGYGNLYFRGAASNPLSGKLQAAYGALHFQKTGGASPYNGNQIEIGVMDIANFAYLELHASDCIPDGATLTFAPSGVLRMNGFSDVVGAVSMHGGLINGTDGSLLRLGDTLTLTPRVAGTNGLGQAIFESPTLWGEIQFGGASATIHVTTNIAKIEAVISEYSTPSPINKTGPGQLTLAAANTFAGQLNVLEGKVFAEESTSLGTTAGNTVVANGASLELPDGVTLSEPLVLHGAGVNGGGALQLDVGGNTTASGLITVSNLARVFVPAAQQLQFSGVVAGPGGLEKTGPGDLLLAGVSANTFSGASFVNGGRMLLGKTSNTKAVASVTVTNGAHLAFQNNELMDNAGVLSIYSGGSVNLTNRNETIGGLNLGRGVVLDTGAGTLTLLGGVFVGMPYSTNVSGMATLRGGLSLGGGTRAILTTNSNELMLDCAISDGAGVGGLNLLSGAMWLMRSNSFIGPVTLAGGTCYVSNTWAFGASGGGVFAANSAPVDLRLIHPAMDVSGETLTVMSNVTVFAYGINAWNGPVVLTNNGTFSCWPLPGAVLTCDGQISGDGNFELYNFTGEGTARLTQSNSYSGFTSVVRNKLIVQHPRALGGSGQGTYLSETATLQLELPDGAEIAEEFLSIGNAFATEDAFLTVVGAVSNTWTGPITNKCPALVVDVPGSGTLRLNGGIAGSGGIRSSGAGSLYLTGADANTYTGDTIVTNGTLFLNKPNGVQAVANLTINNPGALEWSGSEQIADSATLRLDNSSGALGSHNETLTRLELLNGAPALQASTGTLTLLGDIDVTGGTSALLGATTVLNPGTHRITGFPATLTVPKSIHETGGSAGLSISDSYVVLESSNSFSGPIALANDARVIVRHPAALGSPAQGVFTTNWSAIVLDLPPGGVMDPEPVSFGSGVSDLGFLYLYSGKTNTWTGPVTINGTAYFIPSPLQSRITVSGTVGGSGGVRGGGQGEVVLTGSGTNTFNGLTTDNNGGSVRLAKPPGVPALGGNILLDLFNNQTSRVILDAPNQFSPLTEVNIGPNGTFDLNGQPATLRRLIGSGQVAGNGQLTISNPPAGFDTDYSGGFASTLIKQGAGQVTFSGVFAGDLIVEGGTFNRTCAGGAGQTVISPGAVVTSSGANFFNFGALSGGGTFQISGPNNIVGGPLSPPASSTFSGAIIGTNTGASLTKLGSGDLTLTGPVSLVSTTLVVNGTLLVNTVMTNPVVVNSPGAGNFPTLGGTGTVGNVTLSGVGARIAPGATTNVPSYGTLTVASLTAGAGTGYRCEIGGTNAGVNLDQINATGVVTLSGGFAEFSAFGTGTTSNRYAVVKSVSAVSGTFSGDPEGDMIFPAAGRSMVITYLTAAGKEITLIEQPGANLANLSISNIVQQVNGHITLTGTGNSGSTYYIEGNTNLATTNWVTLGSVTSDWNGGISFTDTNAPSFPQRFYRFRLQ